MSQLTVPDSNAQAYGARKLGAKIVERRIDWIWAMQFPSLDAATECADKLRFSGFEVRGPHDFGAEDSRGFCVGWKDKVRRGSLANPPDTLEEKRGER